VPEHAGLLGVRLLAIDAGEPVYPAPLTLISVMTADCVDGETYFGVRADEAVAAPGSVIVKRAVAAAPLAPLGGGAAGAVSEGVPAPPEQLHNAHRAASQRTRARINVII
jgi:hypothetical protein